MVKSSLKSKSLSLSSPAKSVTIGRDCSKDNIYGFISMSIGIIIAIVIISSLNNLEHSNCKCADLPHRRFIKEWFIFLIFYYLIIFVLFSTSNEACWQNFMKYPYIYTSILIVALVNVIMLIRLFLYVRILRDNCSCGYGNKEKFIYWYLLIVFSIWAFLFVLILSILIFTVIKFL